ERLPPGTTIKAAGEGSRASLEELPGVVVDSVDAARGNKSERRVESNRFRHRRRIVRGCERKRHRIPWGAFLLFASVRGSLENGSEPRWDCCREAPEPRVRPWFVRSNETTILASTGWRNSVID